MRLRTGREVTMLVPRITPEDKAWLKYTFLGAVIASVVGAAVEIGKDEIKIAIDKRRGSKDDSKRGDA